MRTQAAATAPDRAQGVAPVDATELLMSDHRAVDALFEEFDSTTARSKKVGVAKRICDELTVHARVEEEIFYPQALALLPKDDADLIWEATVEHGTLAGLIEVIRKAEPGEDQFDAYVTVLKEYVQHHVKEEEESMFPKVRKSGADLDAIGAALGERKLELLEEMKAGARGGRGGGASRTGGASGARKAAKRA